MVDKVAAKMAETLSKEVPEAAKARKDQDATKKQT